MYEGVVTSLISSSTRLFVFLISEIEVVKRSVE
jgi:hypothetical protein